MRAISYHMNQTFSEWRKNKSICYFSLPLEPALWILRCTLNMLNMNWLILISNIKQQKLTDQSSNLDMLICNNFPDAKLFLGNGCNCFSIALEKQAFSKFVLFPPA